VHLASLELEHKVFDMNDMKLQGKSPHPLEYVPTNHCTHNTHDGQMKLLMTDEMSIMLGLIHICSKSAEKMQDLRRDGGPTKVAVVVAGAAPGDHFFDLSNTFGLVDFHLYDPAPRRWYSPLAAKSSRRPRDESNVWMYTQKFTMQTANEWTDKKRYEHVIFLSDLRTQGESPFPSKDEIAVDMENQRQMIIAINACYSVLKFRPRYYDDTDPHADDYRTLKYFDGTIYLQG
jgi:hypothetical protein